MKLDNSSGSHLSADTPSVDNLQLDDLPDNNPNSQKATPYGEMVPTSFAWVSPDEQRKKAKELENVGKASGAKNSNENPSKQ